MSAKTSKLIIITAVSAALVFTAAAALAARVKKPYSQRPVKNWPVQHCPVCGAGSWAIPTPPPPPSLPPGAVGISSAAEFIQLLQGGNINLAGHYVLTADIDLSDSRNWNNGAGFAPIGNQQNPFRGIFDGGGHTITGLYINRPNAWYVGLFGATNGATIRNVGVTDANISGNRCVGGLVGYTSGGTFIINSYVTGSVVGGESVGGLVAASEGGTSISKSYATASVRGNWYVGGVVGYTYQGSSITNSYATGSVTGNNCTGGLVGWNYDHSSITNSYATGRVTGYPPLGGLVGRDVIGGPVTNSYWDIETSGQTSSAGGTGKTTAEMKTQSTFTNAGWDFNNVWTIDSNVNNGYPTLRE